MKLSYKDIEPFVRQPDPKARAILVYGPDDGLMRERAALIGQKIVSDLNDPFNACVLTTDRLTEDPARLFDEANAMSLMGGARLIRIEQASDKLTLLLKEYLNTPSKENLVLLEAGELGPRSSLRLLFEKAPNAAALPCYVDDVKSVSALIQQTLSVHKLRIDQDALVWLGTNIAGDRARVRSELEKIVLYAGHSSKTLTLEDVCSVCGDVGEQTIDALIESMMAGKVESSMMAYAKLLEEGIAVVTILRSLQNHYRRLHMTRSRLNAGEPIEEAMKSLQPPVFFKNAESFKTQVRKWSAEKLMRVLQRLSSVEAQTKKGGAAPETLCAQAILSLSVQK